MGRAAGNRQIGAGDGAAGRAERVASWYWIGATASLMFMLLGCAVYAMHLYTDPATLPLDQRVMFEAEPAWITTMLGLASVLGDARHFAAAAAAAGRGPSAARVTDRGHHLVRRAVHDSTAARLARHQRNRDSRHRARARLDDLPVRAPFPSARVAPLISLAGSASFERRALGRRRFLQHRSGHGTVSREICRLGSCER